MLARPNVRHLSRFSIRAFTLIELLVVIAIIALLISILLPALGKAKCAGAMLREQAGAQQIGVAYMGYAYENNEATFTGYIPWAVGHLNDQPGRYVWLHPDPWNDKYMIEGNVIKVAGTRFMGATGLIPEAMMLDQKTFRQFQSRPLNATYNNTYSPRTSLYDGSVADRAAAYSYHPSIGFNYVYVGGSASQGAFTGYAKGDNFGRGANIGHPRKKFYVTKISEITRTDKLMLGASSRGVDVGSIGGWTGQGNSWGSQNITWSANSPIVPGFWTILPPSPQYGTGSGGGAPATGRISWVASNKFVRNSNPLDWGYVDMRCGGRAIALMADGHVETLTLKQMRDMRRWSNDADSENWVFRP